MSGELTASASLSDELGDLIGERCIEIAKRGDDVLAQLLSLGREVSGFDIQADQGDHGLE